MRPFWLLVACLVVVSGCSGATPRSAQVAEQSEPAPDSLQRVSDSEEWYAFELCVAGMLFREQYDSLDSLAATFGPDTPAFRNGRSRERYFYLALAGENFEITKGQRARFIGYLKRWREEKPDSRAAAAGYACALVELAWDERGGAVAANVSDEQFSRFDKDLALAWEALAPTAGKRGNVGGWYMAAARVGRGQGWERGRLMQLRNDCLRDAPWNETIEGSVAVTLLPRWGGEPGESERFAMSVATSSPDGRGPQRYVEIVTALQGVHANVFRDTDVSWPTAHAGLEALEREHPDSITLPSRHAKFAWLARDHAVASALFARLGNRIDPWVWDSDEEFLSARAWASAPPS